MRPEATASRASTCECTSHTPRNSRTGPKRPAAVLLFRMQITVNGETMSLDRPCTIAELMAGHRAGPGPDARGGAYAVEVNRQLIPRREHDTHQINDGDDIEIVTLVGGG